MCISIMHNALVSIIDRLAPKYFYCDEYFYKHMYIHMYASYHKFKALTNTRRIPKKRFRKTEDGICKAHRVLQPTLQASSPLSTNTLLLFLCCMHTHILNLSTLLCVRVDT